MQEEAIRNAALRDAWCTFSAGRSTSSLRLVSWASLQFPVFFGTPLCTYVEDWSLLIVICRVLGEYRAKTRSQTLRMPGLTACPTKRALDAKTEQMVCTETARMIDDEIEKADDGSRRAPES